MWQTAQECFNRHKHSAIVVGEQQCNSKNVMDNGFDTFFSFLSFRQQNSKNFSLDFVLGASRYHHTTEYYENRLAKLRESVFLTCDFSILIPFFKLSNF